MKKSKKILVNSISGALVLFASLANGQAITFDLDNLFANPSCGPLMFEDFLQVINNQCNFPNPPPANGCPFYAFENFSWQDGLGPGGEAATSAPATVEELNVIAGVGGVSLKVDGLELVAFNSDVAPIAANYNAGNLGNFGDTRIYENGNAQIIKDGVTVLDVTDVMFDLSVGYPAPYGNGTFSSAFGIGTINAAGSDAAWIAELDPNNTGTVTFTFTSISQTAIVFPDLDCNNWYGYYDATVKVEDNDIVRQAFGANIDNGNESVSFPTIGIDFNFASATQGGGGGSNNKLTVLHVGTDPDGELPAGINNVIGGQYWHFGTSLSAFSTEVIFDLSFAGQINDPTNLRIIRRPEGGDWEMYLDFDLINGNSQMRANNVSEFSDWTIGSIGDDPLSVELTSFRAVQIEKSIQLSWQTQSEKDNKGFVVQRATQNGDFVQIASYETHTELVGQGNTSSATNYSFVDEQVDLGKTYLYKVVDVDFNGIKTESEVIEITLNADQVENSGEKVRYKLAQNFPNPFNPTTKISFTMVDKAKVDLEIFDLKGNFIKSIASQVYGVGEQSAVWDGTDANGNLVSSGIYFYKLTTSTGFTDIKKMTFLK